MKYDKSQTAYVYRKNVVFISNLKKYLVFSMMNNLIFANSLETIDFGFYVVYTITFGVSFSHQISECVTARAILIIDTM